MTDDDWYLKSLWAVRGGAREQAMCCVERIRDANLKHNAGMEVDSLYKSQEAA